MPATLGQYVALAALAISLLALIVSFANLWWNMYRELALRGRLRVDFGVKEIIQAGCRQAVTRVVVSATNWGPGVVTVSMIAYKEASLWRRLLRRVKIGVIIWDYTDALSSRLPQKLEVGDTVNLTLKYGPEFKLNPGVTHVGLNDSFGRSHWAPICDIRRFRRDYQENFPEQRPNKSDTAI